MGWAIGYDENWKRDVGYGVPSNCDHPGCAEQIDRGLGYICGSDVGGGDKGCGLFFCGKHMRATGICVRCSHNAEPFTPTPDTAEWIAHKLAHDSWAQWRSENPEWVANPK